MNENHLPNTIIFPKEEDSLRLHQVTCIGPIEETSVENMYTGNRLEEIVADPVNIINNEGLCRFQNKGIQSTFLLDQYSTEDMAIDLTKYNIKNKKLYLQFNLTCPEDTSTVFRLGGQNILAKVWMNQILVFCGRLVDIDTEILLVNAKQGNNCIFIELHGKPINTLKTLFSCYISDYTKNNKNEILQSYYEKDLLHKIVLITERRDIENPRMQFIINRKDFITVLPQEITINFYDKNECFLERRLIWFGELVEYDTTDLRYNQNDFLYIEVEYLAGETQLRERFVILLCCATDHFFLLKQRFLQIKKNDENSQSYEFVQQWLGYIEQLLHGEIISKSFDCNSLSIYLNDVQIINCHMDVLEQHKELIGSFNGTYRMNFYKSNLDQTSIRYDVKLPLAYDSSKKYPLLIYIPNAIYEEQGIYCLSNTIQEDIILAELCLRGMTFGSFIGEAAFFEGFNLLLTSYSVNTDKIYLMGACSAAYASLSLAQCYPDLFAGLIISNGEIDVRKAMNLSNVPIINLCTKLSNKLKKVYHIPTLHLTQYGQYEAHLLDISQESLSYLIYNNKYLVEWVLKYTRNRYPKIIRFHSDYKSYQKCFWCNILEKRDTDKACLIKGELSETGIHLKIVNVNKMQVICDNNHITNKLPVMIDSDSGNYDILAKHNLIHILKTDKAIESTKDCICNVNDRGILQVYMNALKIVITPEATDGKITEKIIDNLSNPKSSGHAPDIYIKYPKIAFLDMTEFDYINSNLIIIGDACNTIPAAIKNNLPFQLAKTSFTYKGYSKTGNYFIMFIMPNPLAKDFYILFVYANESSLYRNIFTRKLVMPTYLNSMQCELENEAILYDGNMYYYAKHIGDDIIRMPGI